MVAAPPSVITLRSANQSSSLRDQLARSLADGTDPTFKGTAWEYNRTIPTMVLYTDRGLEVYDELSRTKAYYPFEAEKEILETYGDEIAARMFGLPTSERATQEQLESDQDQEQSRESPDYQPTPAANRAPLKEKWGDSQVGTHNNGVNGNANDLSAKIGLAVELGSGSLDKTRHLLRSLSKVLQRKDGPQTIEYKALDLEKASLVNSLTSLLEQEPDSVKASEDSSPRVLVGGMHADYWEGLAHLKNDAVQSNGTASGHSNGHSEQKNGLSTKTTTSILWLGSSVGNFNREEAVEFLKNVKLAPGDTMLIGIDNCDDKEKIETAYNDPEGVTRRFILEGLDHAGDVLHGKLDGKGGLVSENFEYASRYNKQLGRHEAYVRCKVQGLQIPLPAAEGRPATTITLRKDELLHIEVSYKYTQPEAVALFHASGFRLIQQWSDSQHLHTVYLLEQPPILFPSQSPLLKELGVPQQPNPYGVPSLDEWHQMWKVWDMLTLEIIPKSLLMTKPIPLRHIPLFYLGHIPAFRDIHLSRYFSEPLTAPEHFAELFERGIDPDCADPSKISHWHSEVPTEESKWPRVEEIVSYEHKVRERVKQAYELSEGKWTRGLARVMMMVFEHEAMHMETLCYIALQACDSLKAPHGFSIPDFPSLARSRARSISSGVKSRRPVLSFPSSTVEIGHDDTEADDLQAYDPAHEFGWDVEHPKRSVDVKEFKMDALPVTNGEYAQWLESKGETANSELFPASWSWKGDKDGQIGKYGIAVKTLYGEVKLDYAEEWPLCGSAVQLQAFAKSKGGRLPSRYELAVFLKASPVDAPTSNIGLANLHPVPPTAPASLRDGSIGGGSDGGVWQWSSTVLDAHDGYIPSNLYPGYSSDFHDGKHLIIVGASYATPRRLARPSFTNWYQASYPYVIAGARVAY